jgi:GTP-binding protein
MSFIAERVGRGEVKLLVLLTKADKLGRSEANTALAAMQALLGEYSTERADIGVTLFSALKKIGVEDAALSLHGWAHPQRRDRGGA